jgi:hypothetical protein
MLVMLGYNLLLAGVSVAAGLLRHSVRRWTGMPFNVLGLCYFGVLVAG